MGKKRRVFQVARELSISNEAVISYLVKLDKSVKTQMSAVADNLYDQIRQEFDSGMVASPEADQDFRQQLKEKQVLEEMRRNKAREELEERIRFATQLAEDAPKRKERVKEKEAADELAKKAAKEIEDAAAIEEIVEEPSIVDIISQAKKEIDKHKKAEDKAESASVPAPESSGKATKSKKGAESVSEPVVEQLPKPGKEKAQPVPDAAGAVSAEPSSVKGKTPSTKDQGKGEKGKSKGALTSVVESGDASKSRRKGKKKKKRKISEEEIQASIKQTLASMGEVKQRRHKRKSKDVEDGFEEEDTNVIEVSEFISASELADLIEVEPGEVIKVCLELGMMISINQRLDMDTIEAVADEFGFEIKKIQEYGTDLLDQYVDTEEDMEQAVVRPPVVTIMGHVDHGKTSLLDYVRKASVVAGESGGITQHIGAYEVKVKDKIITFLDTPGHEAFTAMRARGAQVTDLVVLVVAADDGVQPQTVEAMSHAMAASVPVVVAINKMDRPAANPDHIKKQLSERNVLVEEWGGKYQCIELSAKTGVGVDLLLDQILLEAEMLELKANPDRTARGVIIESKLDKGKGPVATVLIQGGTLKVGDLFIAGHFSGKVRAMYDEHRRKVSVAPPSTPVQVIGFDGVPQAGDGFVVMKSEREVREISTKRQQLKREQDFRRQRHVTLDQIAQQIKQGQLQELNVILKADVDGSNEALSESLVKLSNEEVSVNVIHKGVGGISESDVLLASASNAVIIGFHVRPTVQARELAKKEEIDVRLYDIIYSVVEDVKAALEGMLSPEITEELTATIEVRETFKVPKVGTIAGSYVVSGKASRTDFVRIYREDKRLHETKIASLKRFKEDVKEVASGFECGVGLVGFDDLKIGDIIETYRKIETARKLD